MTRLLPALHVAAWDDGHRRYRWRWGGWRAVIGTDAGWCVEAPTRGLAVIDGQARSVRRAHVVVLVSLILCCILSRCLGWWRDDHNEEE